MHTLICDILPCITTSNIRFLGLSGNMATLEIWDYGIFSRGKDDNAVGPTTKWWNVPSLQDLARFFLAEVEDRGRVFVVWNLNSKKLDLTWRMLDMGHGISLGFETPKELHHSNSTRGIVIDRYWPILTWRIGVSAIGAEVAATGRPDMVDPALMRPGRFDKICYCGQDLNLFFPFSQVPKSTKTSGC